MSVTTVEGNVITVDMTLARRKSMKVMFAVPIDSGASSTWITSQIRLHEYFRQIGIPCEFRTIPNDSLITRARNALVAMFLADASFTHLMWIDSDIAFEPQYVETLVCSDKEVCGAAYPLKTFNFDAMAQQARLLGAKTQPKDLEGAGAKFVINTHTEEIVEKMLLSDDPKSVADLNCVQFQDGQTEVSEMGTGFMCIKRLAFLKMIDAYPDDWYHTDMPCFQPMDMAMEALGLHCFYTFFDCFVFGRNRRYLSEDYAFCQKYRMLGGKIYLYANVTLGHTGPIEFKSNYWDFLLKKQEMVKAEEAQKLARLEALKKLSFD